MTRKQFEKLPRLDRTPKPYHFRLRSGGVAEQGISYVLNRDATQVGVVIGSSEYCPLAGCSGIPLSVRWPDGSLTKPCTKGMVDVPGLPDVLRIG